MGEIAAFESPLEIWLLVMTAAFFIVLVFCVILFKRVNKLQKRLHSFVKDTGVPDLESVIHKLHAKTEQASESITLQQRRIDELEQKTGELKGNVGFLRYNAFADRGSDLSFSLAIVNDRKDGVVLSTIHSRDESFVYAKPLENGNSSYVLTPEEKEAVNQAIRKK